MASSERPPRFPYGIIWPGFGNEQITLGNLVSFEEQFSTMNDMCGQLGIDVPVLERAKIEHLTQPLVLDAERKTQLADHAWRIALLLVAEKQQGIAVGDIDSARKALEGFIKAAKVFEDALGDISPTILASMYWMRALEPDARKPEGGSFYPLNDEVHDMALVASRILEDTAATDGRPKEHVRDSAIRLTIQALRLSGVDDLKVSNGTKARPDPHLSGNAGIFLAGLFELTTGLSERSLAPIVKLVRRKSRAG